MMALFFGYGSDSIDKIQSLLEIREGEFAGDVMLIDHVPIGKLMAESMELLAF
jgi:hypothetical protein